jgi:multidrug efflux pump subunit AcrA (membrane-fusion protein)
MLKRLMTKQWILVVVLVVAGLAIFEGWSFYTDERTAQARVLRASGRLEATEVDLASELGGVLATRPVREGDRVQRGQIVATFDTDLLDQQIQSAPDTATRMRLQLQRDRQTLRAPLDGWVVRTNFEAREVVSPGVPVVVVADWRALTLKVYLPEDQFGRVTIGQSASVSVDAYGNDTFSSKVTSIASDAEFTPRDMQTQEDRVKSVYAIKLRVPNPDLRLKPGMFADAAFTVSVS